MQQSWFSPLGEECEFFELWIKTVSDDQFGHSISFQITHVLRGRSLPTTAYPVCAS
jgi:hypothetical protein